ncbi:hypothetical protein P886_0501 [Alteromonadaceae bacterium 2753L.S.0a.02]|nr:hypothetical protein P886_0501 [Alteromonadaceae bacterium 2753L.S.0a.02]
MIKLSIYSALLSLAMILAQSGNAQLANEFSWERYAGPSVNQGGDGPCEYITRTWAVEYAIRMAYDVDGPEINLSEQHIYQRCFQSLSQYSSCTSPESITALCMADFIRDYGIANEACLPAPVQNGISQYSRTLLSASHCIDPCYNQPNSAHFSFTAPLEYVNYSYQMGINSNDDLKASIIKYGPHSLYFLDGPYVNSEHAILILGWNSSNEWVFQNSSEDYFAGRGVDQTFGVLAFDISEYTNVKVGRVNGIPMCSGAGCSQFQRRPLDSDGDGFCSIAWGDLPVGLNCEGHDANDNDSSLGPYTVGGFTTELVSGSTITLNSYQQNPMRVTASSRILLKPGFKYKAQSGGRDFIASVSN